jgi:multidrug efflux pump subunit AcrB
MAESVGSLKLSFIFAILAIYAMLAIPFKSYVLPLIVAFNFSKGTTSVYFYNFMQGNTATLVCPN